MFQRKCLHTQGKQITYSSGPIRWSYLLLLHNLSVGITSYTHTHTHTHTHIHTYIHTYRCPRRNVPDFGRVFLMLKYTDITQNTYVQSWTVTEIMAREKCGLLTGPRTVPVSWHSYPFPSLSVVSYFGNSADANHWTALHMQCRLWLLCEWLAG